MNENMQNISYYPGHMAKTKRELKERIKLIDIIYEVIDARIPVSSKLKDMDEIIKSIPRVLVMTKKDLCDMSVTSKWIKYYENKGYKVVCIDTTNNNDYKKLIEVTKKLAKPINEKRKKNGLKDKDIKIGVIGIPNVGKSTLINKLAGKKVANTGNKPGVTKQVTWLKTKHGFTLLDTPGILWPRIDDNEEALALASVASIRIEVLNITDIGGYLISYLLEYYPEKLASKYKISISGNVQDIFSLLAQKFNFYEFNEIDYEKVSLRVYNDVVSGRVKGVTFNQWR